jgi:hypothetical protein
VTPHLAGTYELHVAQCLNQTAHGHLQAAPHNITHVLPLYHPGQDQVSLLFPLPRENDLLSGGMVFVPAAFNAPEGARTIPSPWKSSFRAAGRPDLDRGYSARSRSASLLDHADPWVEFYSMARLSGFPSSGKESGKTWLSASSSLRLAFCFRSGWERVWNPSLWELSLLSSINDSGPCPCTCN